MQLSSRTGHRSSALACACLGWDAPMKSQCRWCVHSHLASSAAVMLKRKSPASQTGAVLTTHFSRARRYKKYFVNFVNSQKFFLGGKLLSPGSRSPRSSAALMPMLLAVQNSSILLLKSFSSSGHLCKGNFYRLNVECIKCEGVYYWH